MLDHGHAHEAYRIEPCVDRSGKFLEQRAVTRRKRYEQLAAIFVDRDHPFDEAADGLVLVTTSIASAPSPLALQPAGWALPAQEPGKSDLPQFDL